jgi:methylenetetrahydrofolate dehydrogenase (NADP+)/methenyltetrahydrofolate cyclohydrolase
VIDELNADPACEGRLIQLPLPDHLDTAAALSRVDPAKDADGPHSVNLGRPMLDVGITRTDDGQVGDVHPDVREVAEAPMPGGAGPMTIAMLVGNVVQAAERRIAARQA